MANKINYRRWGIFILSFTLMSLPLFVSYAQNAVSENLIPCGQSVRGADGKMSITNPCDYNDFLLLIKKVFDFLAVKIAVPLAAATIVIGGAIMMMAGSNSGKRDQAKKIIWAAVWGLVIVMTSVLIVKLIFDTLVDPNSGYTPNLE